jgi:hypothetical protein
MALAHAVVVFVAVWAFLFAAASVGNLILRTFHVEMETDAQYLLICAGLGVLSIEVLLFAVEATQQIRKGCFVVLALLAIVLLAEFKSMAQRLFAIVKAAFSGTLEDHCLLLLIGIVLSVEFLTSLAPLTGSDALHYHFTTQKLILEYGFRPEFSISHSFLCGQHHLLILFGLALGSEQLAMGLLFLGGVLTASALGCLAYRLASRRIALVITLLFLLTPVVFWQFSSSGAPDIWMAFYACATVLVLCQNTLSGTWRQALLAGLLTGGIAGAKYTGCIIAAGLAAAITIEYRSVRCTSLLCTGSLFTGCWPYLRNFVWTGDPVFPFLTRALFPDRVNLFALEALLADTGASRAGHFGQLIPFLFFAGTHQNSLGFWDFFGPIIFAFAPLLIPAFLDFRRWRAPAVVWCISALGEFYASGLPRFLLPVFPLALACIAAGIDSCELKGWKMARGMVSTLATMVCVSGGVGLLMYSWKPIATSLGIVRKVSYLEERRPEYQEAMAINVALANRSKGGKTLLFVRHMYSLEVPFLNGDPASSWIIDPARLRTTGDWKAFFQQEGIRFVARSPEYPAAIETPLTEMETSGDFVPIARMTVRDFEGMRIEGKRTERPVIIFEVKSVARQ